MNVKRQIQNMYKHHDNFMNALYQFDKEDHYIEEKRGRIYNTIRISHLYYQSLYEGIKLQGREAQQLLADHTSKIINQLDSINLIKKESVQFSQFYKNAIIQRTNSRVKYPYELQVPLNGIGFQKYFNGFAYCFGSS